MIEEDIRKALIQANMRIHSVGTLGLLSVFDDIQFFNFDYDVIPGPERQKIRKGLVEAGWRDLNARSFQKDQCRIGFAKPSHTLGCNPADKVREALSLYQYQFVTPTQALLTLAAEGCWDTERARSLVYEQAANLEKFSQWIKADGIEISYSMKDLARFQEQGLLKRKGRAHKSFKELLQETT